MQNLSKTGSYFGDPGGTYPPKLYLSTPPPGGGRPWSFGRSSFTKEPLLFCQYIFRSRECKPIVSLFSLNDHFWRCQLLSPATTVKIAGWSEFESGQYERKTVDCGLRTADCGLRTADCGPGVKCRLQTKGKMKTRGKMQNEDCRLQIREKMREIRLRS